jgi:glucose-6-phosphate 1-dehydrogenase
MQLGTIGLGRMGAKMLASAGVHNVERVLTDAMEGDRTLFARQDDVEEAWRIVDPVLNSDAPLFDCAPGAWGPKEADQRVAPPGGWNNPTVAGRS